MIDQLQQNLAEIELLKGHRRLVNDAWMKSIEDREDGKNVPQCITDNLLKVAFWLDGVIGEWHNRPSWMLREPLTGLFYQAELKYQQAICDHEDYEQGDCHWEGSEYLSNGVREDNIRWVVRCHKCGAELEETVNAHEYTLDEVPF